MTDRAICCSFCGKSSRDANVVISGPDVCICDECVTACSKIVTDFEEAQRAEVRRFGT